MTPAKFDVLCIGNAIVDVLARVDDAFLTRHGIAKGGMTLIDEFRARQLEHDLKTVTLASGGSAGNTSVGVASFGARSAFIGRVRDDALGESYIVDIRRAGVHFETVAARTGAPTARSVILITADAQRSMNTYLGASVELGPEDLDGDLVAQSAIFYIEGYLWDPPRAKDAILAAIDIAKANGRRVALTLSDSFCVGRYRAEFLDLIDGPVDILFANESEITSLYETEDFDIALQRVRATGKIAALTRSAKGSLVVHGDEVHVIDADKTHVVDTTGAGDLYAAGFMVGLTRGRLLHDCGRLGSLAAAEVISHIGPRPKASLKVLAASRGLL